MTDIVNAFKLNGQPAVTPRPDCIPAFLQQLPAANWIAEPRADGKIAKAPRNPNTGIKIGANNPAVFGTFEQAVTALNTGHYSGLGVLLTGNGITGVDIDNYAEVFEQRPEVKAWVAKARAAGAYCEVSPSGKGLRLFVGGSLPGKGRKVGHLEIYDDKRYLTVTGKQPKGAPACAELIADQNLIDGFLALLPPENSAAVSVPIGSAIADTAQVEQLCARVAEKRPALWVGAWQNHALEYPSQSEADYALCGAIAREAVRLGVADDALADTIMSVFQNSALYREEKHRQIEQYAIPKIVAEALAQKVQATRQADLVTQTDDGAELAIHEPGDILAGRTYARAMSGKLLYVGQAGKWMRWDGTRWEWCACGEEMAAAKYVAGKTLDHATTLFKADPAKHKKLMAFATSLQNLKRMQAMIELAKSEEGMGIGHMTELDSDPWLLGVRNGVVNLKDGGLLAADPAMLITRQVAAEYQSITQCPRWLAFLDQVFDSDQETIDYLQRALGYTLTGITTEEILFVCYGFGANGKSVFANVVSSIMADYAQMAPASLLTVRRDGDAGPRNDIARLCGARGLQINELQQGDRLDEQVVKMLAGREMLSARFLHREFFDFWPTAKPWLRTNHRPIITGEDDGIWRRIHLIPFKRKFAEHERDPWLEQKLLDERDGILAWMVQGCLDWQRRGLKPSPLVRRESGAYRKESDLLGEFLDERTVASIDARVEQPTLYAQWRSWNEANGTRAGSKASFTRKLSERGHAEVKSNGRRFYAGLHIAVDIL